MTFYWLTFSLLSFFALTDKTRHRDQNGFFRERFNLLSISFLLLFIFVIGFRFNVGGDWINYLNTYLDINTISVSQAIFGDPAYAFLNWLSYKIGIGFHGLNAICAAIFTYGLLKFCRYLPRPNMALLVAFPYLIMIVGMGYQRQSVAIGLSMLATLALFRHKNLKFFLLISLAAAFHKSAILFFPLIIFTATANRFAIFLGVVFFVLAGYFLFVEARLTHFLEHYITSQKSSSGAFIRVAMLVLPSIIFLYYRKRFKLSQVEMRFWILMSSACFPMLAAILLMNISTTIDRFALYILPIQLFVFSYLPEIFKKSNKPLVSLFIIIYYSVVLFVWSNFATNSNHWIPYDNAVLRFIIGEQTYFGE